VWPVGRETAKNQTFPMAFRAKVRVAVSAWCTVIQALSASHVTWALWNHQPLVSGDADKAGAHFDVSAGQVL
jgi:hypothetical protein